MTTEERLAILERFAHETQPLLRRLDENRKEIRASLERLDENGAIVEELVKNVCGVIALIQADVTRIDAG